MKQVNLKTTLSIALLLCAGITIIQSCKKEKKVETNIAKHHYPNSVFLQSSGIYGYDSEAYNRGCKTFRTYCTVSSYIDAEFANVKPELGSGKGEIFATKLDTNSIRTTIITYENNFLDSHHQKLTQNKEFNLWFPTPLNKSLLREVYLKAGLLAYLPPDSLVIAPKGLYTVNIEPGVSLVKGEYAVKSEFTQACKNCGTKGAEFKISLIKKP